MSCGLPLPGPAEDFTVRTVTSAEVGVWYHVYSTLGHPHTTASSFAEGWGNTRFAPLAQADGTALHTYSVASTAQAFQQSLGTVPLLILAALIVVYLILGILYESYIHPLTIISTLPSAGVGALAMLMLFGFDFSLIALIGIVLLMGIVK